MREKTQIEPSLAHLELRYMEKQIARPSALMQWFDENDGSKVKALGNAKVRTDELPANAQLLEMVIWSLDESALLQILCNSCAYGSEEVFEQVLCALETLGSEQLEQILTRDGHRCFSSLLNLIRGSSPGSNVQEQYIKQKRQHQGNDSKGNEWVAQQDIVARLIRWMERPEWRSAWDAQAKEALRLNSTIHVPIQLVCEGLLSADARVLKILNEHVVPWLEEQSKRQAKRCDLWYEQLLSTLTLSVPSRYWGTHPQVDQALGRLMRGCGQEAIEDIVMDVLMYYPEEVQEVKKHLKVPSSEQLNRYALSNYAQSHGAPSPSAEQQYRFWTLVLEQEWMQVEQLKILSEHQKSQSTKSQRNIDLEVINSCISAYMLDRGIPCIEKTKTRSIPKAWQGL